jgi:hypothetical protein
MYRESSASIIKGPEARNYPWSGIRVWAFGRPNPQPASGLLTRCDQAGSQKAGKRAYAARRVVSFDLDLPPTAKGTGRLGSLRVEDRRTEQSRRLPASGFASEAGSFAATSPTLRQERRRPLLRRPYRKRPARRALESRTRESRYRRPDGPLPVERLDLAGSLL